MPNNDPFSEFGGKKIEPKSDPFAEFGGTVLKKKESPQGGASTSQPSSTGLNLSQVFPVNGVIKLNVLQPNPAPFITQQGKDADITQQQTQTQKENKPLKEFYNSLNPDVKAKLDKIQDLVANRKPDELRGFTPEETEHYNFMETPVGKTLGAVAYVGSKATKGTLQIAKGAAHLANIGLTGANLGQQQINDEALDKGFAKADKAADFGLSDLDKTRYEGSKPLSALGMAAEFAPAVATGEALNAPKALMYLQGVGQGKDLADNLEKSGAKLNPIAKEALIQGSGAVNLLLTDIFKGNGVTKAMQDKVITGIAADAVKESAGKNLTADSFKELLQNKVKDFAAKFERVPVEALGHYNETAKTFTKLNLANYALHKSVNAINNKPVFNDTIGGLAEQENKSLTQDAPMFAAIPAIGELSKLMPNSGYHNEIVDAIMKDPSKVDEVKNAIYQHGFDQNNPNGQWSPEEMDATFKHIDKIADAAKSLPRDIPENKREDAVGLVLDRNTMQDKLSALQEQKKALDPSIQGIPTAKEQYYTDKIDQANDKLRDIVKGSKTTYSKERDDKQVETGKFLKTTDGQQEEISPERYALEHTERNAKNEPPSLPTEDEHIQQNKETDQKITDFQIKFPDHKFDPLDDLPDHVVRTFDRIDDDVPTDPTAVKEASDWLYKKYKDLSIMKKSDTRRLTLDQIDGYQKQLGEDITLLEEHAKKYHPDYEKQEIEPEEPVIDEPVPTPEKPTEVDKQLTPTENEKSSSSEKEESSGQESTKKESLAEKGDVKPVPGEVKTEPVTKEEPTGIRNEDVAKERGENIPRTSKTREEIKQGGKDLLESKDFHPDEFAQSIIDKPYPASAEEESALQQHKVFLKSERKRIQAIEDADPAHKEMDLARVADLLEKNRKATEIIGNELARGLGHRTELMNEDYSYEAVSERAKTANGDQPISPEESKALADHTAKIEALETKLAEREEQIKKLEAKRTVDKVKRVAELEERDAKRTITKASLRKEREDLHAELRLIARKSLSNLGANKIPVEMLVPISKLARNYVLDGITTISSVADKIYTDLKDHIDGLDKNDIEDAIKSGFDGYLAEQNKIRLERSKKVLTKRLEDLKDPNYEQRVARKIQVDNDYLKIRADINRQQALINKRIEDIQNSKKSISRKVADFAVKYGRQAKLASVTVIGKLAAAGLSTMALKPVTEAAGGVFSKLLPKIAKKSTIEGGTHFSGLAKAYAKAATEGMKDAYDELNIKKGGMSQLSALYKNKKGSLPAEAAEFFGHLHSAIKAPIKRFTFEQSYAKRVAKQMADGIDITDPIIDAANRLAAYKDAERAIFMGDNKISDAYENAVKSLENKPTTTGLSLSKNAGAILRILFPFVKVPTNIVLSTGRYAFGLVPGLAKLSQVGLSTAAKNLGAEKLSGLIHTAMGELTPEESDMVLRNLKHGSIGGAALAIGFFNPKSVGGYYQPGEKRKKDEVSADGFKVGSTKIPIFLTEHPIFQAMQIGATYRRLLDSHLHKDDTQSAILGTLSGISENVPLAEGSKLIFEALEKTNKFNKLVGNTIKGEVEPAVIQQLATITDTKDGSAISLNPENQQARKPKESKGFIRFLSDDLKTGIPVLRKQVHKK